MRHKNGFRLSNLNFEFKACLVPVPIIQNRESIVITGHNDAGYFLSINSGAASVTRSVSRLRTKKKHNFWIPIIVFRSCTTNPTQLKNSSFDLVDFVFKIFCSFNQILSYSVSAGVANEIRNDTLAHTRIGYTLLLTYVRRNTLV